MSLQQNILEEGLERRGRVYYMRIRVSARFAEVEPRVEINRSLRTRDEAEARARLAVARRSLVLNWEARLRRRATPDSQEAYDAGLALLRDLELPYVPMDALVRGPITVLVERIEALAKVSPESATIPAALGVAPPPSVRFSEMPDINL